MDIRHAETANTCCLIRQSLFMAVKPEVNNVADAQCVDISQLLFRRLAGCCYPIIKPAPIVDGFRVGHKTSPTNGARGAVKYVAYGLWRRSRAFIPDLGRLVRPRPPPLCAYSIRRPAR